MNNVRCGLRSRVECILVRVTDAGSQGTFPEMISRDLSWLQSRSFPARLCSGVVRADFYGRNRWDDRTATEKSRSPYCSESGHVVGRGIASN